MGLLLQLLQLLFNFGALGMQLVGINQRTQRFHGRQHRHGWHFDVAEHTGEAAVLLQFWPQGLVQTQGDISIFGSVRASHIQLDLVEGFLLGTLAGNLFKGHGFVAQVLERQAVHVVAGGNGIQNVAFQLGVELHAFQFDAMVGQNVGVVFHVLADFLLVFVFQNRLQLRQYFVPVELHRSTFVVVRQRHIGSLAHFHGERHTDDFGFLVHQ